MKLIFIFLSSVLLPLFMYSQVGINTDNPNSTLDVSVLKDSSGDLVQGQTIGLQAPRVTREELYNNFGLYSDNQKGALIYVTDVSGGDATENRVNMDSVGYYYFDGSLWQKLTGTSVTASNGLTKTDNNIVLGGTFTQATAIDNAGYDLTITGTGNVGIGTSSPAAALHTVSTTAGGAFQMQDTSQGEGKILVSDANGAGTWTTLNSTKGTVVGTTYSSSTSQRAVSTTTVANTTISLTEGSWLVYIGQMVTCGVASTATSNGWIRFTLTDSSSGLTQSNFTMTTVQNQTTPRALVSTNTSAFSVDGSYYSFAAGVILVNVTPATTGGAVTLYLSFETNIYVGSVTSANTYVGNNRENYFFAVPVN